MTFALVAGGETVTQSQTVHLEAGETRPVAFALALPGPITPFSKATVSAAVKLGAVLVAGESYTVAVNAWSAKPSWNVAWPEPAAGAASFPPIPVHLENLAGDRVADWAVGQVKATLMEAVPPYTVIQQQEISVPTLHAGESQDLSVSFTGWSPAPGQKVRIKILVGSGALYTEKLYDYSTRPYLWAEGSSVTEGSPTAFLRGSVANEGDFSWTGSVTWSLPAAGLSFTEPIVVGPRIVISRSWAAQIPPSLVGRYEWTIAFLGAGLPEPVAGKGYLEIVPLDVQCLWPNPQPVFRHDQDLVFPVTISSWNAPAGTQATLAASLWWSGGSAQLTDGTPITLDPAQPLAVNLTLPITQFPAPGPFSIVVAVTPPSGNFRSWQADYTLHPPAYAGGLTTLHSLPGGLIVGEIQNLGAFEGNAQVSWALTTPEGLTVASDSQTATIPVGGSLPLAETLPASILPGTYLSTVTVLDPATAKPYSKEQALEILGTMPSVTVTTNNTLYGTADAVHLTARVEDSGHIAEGAVLRTEIQRYIGRGGQGPPVGPLGAEWNSPVQGGSGNCTVNSSGWFVDASNGLGPYSRFPGAQPSDIAPIAGDVDGDGRTELIGVSFGALTVSWEEADQQQYGGGLAFLGCGAPTLGTHKGTQGTMAPSASLVQRASASDSAQKEGKPLGEAVQEDYWFYWTEYPIAATWGHSGDAWDRTFLLGVFEEGVGSLGSICVGVYNSTSRSASVLHVRLDGSVVWRRDLPSPYEPGYEFNAATRHASGPVFVDLNGDGIRDVLFRSRDFLFALNGQTGVPLWTLARPAGTYWTFRLASSPSGPRIWIAEETYGAGNVVLVGANGQVVYQTSPAGGVSRYPMVTGDLDGDGSDELVIRQAWNETNQPLQVFRMDGLSPEVTSFDASSDVALVDINGDGRKEAVFSYALDYFAPDVVYAVDLLSEQVHWSVTLPEPPDPLNANGGLPVVYSPTSGRAKLVFAQSLQEPSRTEEQNVNFRWFFMDLQTGVIEQAVEELLPGYEDQYLAADFNGDGVSEWYQGLCLVDVGCVGPDGHAGPCSEWETVWQWDDVITENSEASVDYAYDAGPMGTPGAYRAVASIITNTSQRLDSDPSGFSVVETSLGLVMNPSAGSAIRTDESLEGSVTVSNRGAATENGITVSLLVDGQVHSSWEVSSLDAGASQAFSFTLPPSAAGKHAVEVQALEGGSVVARLQSGYISAVPQLELAIEAPGSHTEDPFTFTVKVSNTGLVPVQAYWSLSDDPARTFLVDLPAGEADTILIERQSVQDYLAQLEVTGDLQQALFVSVPYAFQLAMSINDMEPQEPGLVVALVNLSQNGDVPYSGQLTAILTLGDGSIKTAILPVTVPAASSADLMLELTAAVPGSTHLRVEAARSNVFVEEDFLVFVGGIGTLEATLPSVIKEGLTEIPFTVHNTLPVEGDFTVESFWNSGAGSEPLAQTTLVLGASESAQGSLSQVLSPGAGTLQVLLNGVVAHSQTVTVLPGIAGNLTLEAVTPPDAMPSVTAVVRNTGFEAFDATLASLTDHQSTEAVHLESGAEASIALPVDPDAFAGNEAPVQATLHLPDGTSVERTLTLALRPPQLSVSVPSAPLTLTPGSGGTLALAVENGGDQGTDAALSVSFRDGELGYYEETVRVNGHAQTQAAVQVPLAWDVPNGSSFAHYVLRQNDESGPILAEGDLPVVIEGPTVTASAHMDGVAYPVGSTAALTVDLGLSPLGSEPREVTLRVIGGAYEEDRTVTVAGTRSESFAVPVSQGMDGVLAEVLQPGGRSLYINRFRVYPLGAGLSIYPDKNVYSAGESVQVSAALPSQGSLHLNFMNQDVTLTGSGTLTHSFTTPADASEDVYTVAYDFTPDDSAVEPSSGGLPVDVHGIVISGGDSRLDKSRYVSGETISGTIALQTSHALSGALKLWIVYPDGTFSAAGEQSATLALGLPTRIPVSVPFSTTMAGTHRLTYSFVGPSGTSYVGGSLPFSSGGATLLSLGLDQADYPYGTEPVTALVRAAGAGPATVAIEVDGTSAGSASLNIGGVSSQAVSLSQPAVGEHSLKATLVDASGMISTAWGRFTYGSRLPDLSGAVSAAGRDNNSLTLAIAVDNRGASAAAECQASVYDGDPQAGGILAGTAVLPAIQPGASAMQTVLWDVTAMQGPHELYLVVDSASQVREWDESNNTTHASITILPAPVILITPEENSCSRTEVTPQVEVTPEGYTSTATLNDALYTIGTPIQDEGDYTLKVTASDPSSGSSFASTRHFYIDSTPPFVGVNSPAEGACEQPGFVPDLQGSDPHGVSWTADLNGQAYQVGSPIVSEGDWTLTASATDSCGNASLVLIRSFITDGTPPTIAIATPLEGDTVPPGTVPDIQGSDPHGVNWTISLNGQSYSPGAPVNESGDYTIIASAADDCGNVSEAVTRHFTVQGTGAPSLPSSINRFAWFGCDSVTVTGNTKAYGVASVGGAQGFGGHIASNGDIRVSGTNTINGNATPGPGHSVIITGNQSQVAGSKTPASAVLTCEEQSVAAWASYAQANNSNSSIPAQYLNGNGQFTVNGNKTCTLPAGIYAVSSFTLNGNAKLLVTGPVVFVVSGVITLNGNVKANENGEPQNLVLVSASAMPVTLNGGLKTSIKVYAPLAPVSLNGNVTGYGSLWGRTLSASGSVVWNRVRDGLAPSLAITEPPDGATSSDSSVQVRISYQDPPVATGVNLPSLHVTLDGQEITGLLSIIQSGATGQSPPLSDGEHVLQAVITDYEGNQAQAQTTFTVW